MLQPDNGVIAVNDTRAESADMK